jgi:glucose/arabinose dehydrogenase
MRTILRQLLKILGIVLVVVAGVAIYFWYGNPSDRPITDTMGTDPVLVEPEEETFPSVSLTETIGWKQGEAPVPGKGLAVSRFAEGLDHPRTMLTLPNGDVLVAETNSPKREVGGVTGFFMELFMDEVDALGASPNRIVLLRDGDGDGKAEQRFTFREKDLDSPSGMAWGDGRLYIANHNAVLAFAFEPGATALKGTPEKLMDLPGGGNHWMRNLLLSQDGKTLFVAVGSASNIAEGGLEADKNRAAIHELNLETGTHRVFGAGMRNPNGMAWNPSSGELWATVQERDMLGPDLVPEYLTNIPIGAHYGWPWFYWKDKYDTRVDHPMPLYLNEYIRKPEYALGAHTGVLGLLFSAGGNVMGEAYANGAFVARHGSWNRKPPVGYDVVFVPFDANGNPKGDALPILTGFLIEGEGETHGRPTWLAWDGTGAMLVSDDTAGIIWRVHSPGAKPSEAPEPIKAESLPPPRELKGEPTGRWKARIDKDYIEMR